MPQELSMRPSGLWTDANPVSSAPDGGMREALNVVIRRNGLVQPRPGFVVDSAFASIGGGFEPRAMFEDSGGRLFVWGYVSSIPEYRLYQLDGTATLISQVLRERSVYKPRTLPVGDEVFFADRDQVAAVDSTSWRRAGTPRATKGYATADTSYTSTAFAADTAVKYRLVVCRKVGGKEVRGAPSDVFTFSVPGADPAANALIQVSDAMAGFLVAGDFVEIYRTRTATPATAEPGDEMFLAAQVEVTASVLTAWSGAGVYDLHIDSTPDASLGAALYTNQGQQGIEGSNAAIPAANDIAHFNTSVFYANLIEPHCVELWMRDEEDADWFRDFAKAGPVITHPTLPAADEKGFWQRKGAVDYDGSTAEFTNLDSVEVSGMRAGMVCIIESTGLPYTAAGVPVTVTSIVTDVGTTYKANLSAAPDGGSFSSRDVIFSDVIELDGELYYPSRVTGGAFDVTDAETAVRHMAWSIESGGFDVVVYDDDPGHLLVCRRDSEQNAITVESTTTDDSIGLSLPATSEQAVFPGRMLFSKSGQPEAVPVVNVLDVGDVTQEIRRIVVARDSLIVFKDDGLYRVTGRPSGFGVGGSFRADLIDPSLRLSAYNSPATLSGRVFAWTNQGVIVVSDHGYEKISDPQLGNELHAVEHTQLSVGLSNAYGVANPDWDEYVIVSSEFSQSPTTRVYVYNNKTQSWTQWDLTPNHMFHSRFNSRLFYMKAGGSDVYKENKAFSEDDIHDETHAVNVSAVTSVDDSHFVTIDSGSGWTPAVGDCLVAGGTKYYVVGLVIANQFLVHTSGAPTGAATAYVGFECRIGWNPRVAGDPTSVKMWQDGALSFEDAPNLHGLTVETRSPATAGTYKDSRWLEPDTDGESNAQSVRYFVPREHARSSNLLVTASIRSALSPWVVRGLRQSFQGRSRKIRREYGASHSGTGSNQGGLLDGP